MQRDTLTEYKTAMKNLERAQLTWSHLLGTGADKRTVRAALLCVDCYRKRLDEAFEAWRATWDGVVVDGDA
jgi:hypothetical protein